MKSIKDILKSYFEKQKDASPVYLFGSAATGRQTAFSDIDVAVLFEPYVPEQDYSQKALVIMDDLSRILSRNVDVVALNKAGVFLRFSVVKNGVAVYERSHPARRSFEVRAIMEYFDFLPIKQRLEAALINGIKEM